MGWRPNEVIFFDADDPNDCERAVYELRDIIRLMYGAATVRQLFEGATPSKEEVRTDKSTYLLALYLWWSTRFGWSVERCAREIATTNTDLSRNKGLPRDRWLGPAGSTSKKTIEKLLRRGIKQMSKDPHYRKNVEGHTEHVLAKWAGVLCESPRFQTFLFEKFGGSGTPRPTDGDISKLICRVV